MRRVFRFALRSYWGPADWIGVAAMPFVLIWAFAPWIWPAQTWLDLHSVTVHDTHVASEVTLSADRTIYTEAWPGTYHVIVRPETGGTVQCEDGSRLTYRSSAEIAPDDVLTLDWWASGPSRSCIDWQPEPGRYIATTEHCFRRFFWTRPSCRSVPSNVFTIYEENG